ncbi:MAG: helix-turn-helix domain-containing protein [Candidatus Caldarchaeales archaeon]
MWGSRRRKRDLDVTRIFRDANEFRDFVSESTIKGYKVEVKKLVQFDVPSIMPSLTLAKKQEQSLSAALELGYYDIPKKVDTRELASIFGISPRAVSEMFRRIHKKLAETYRRKDVLTL